MGLSLLAGTKTDRRRASEPGRQTDGAVRAGSKGEADLVNSHGRFVWYELMTTDMEAAKAFYANVVGWGTRGASAPGLAYSLFTSGDSPVAGLMNVPEGARRTGVPPQWMGYVGVDDVDAAVGRINKVGGGGSFPRT